jgi:hypothetical protein
MNTNVEKYNNTKNIKKILDNFDYNLINLEIVSENVSILKKLYLKIKKIYMLIIQKYNHVSHIIYRIQKLVQVFLNTLIILLI